MSVIQGSRQTCLCGASSPTHPILQLTQHIQEAIRNTIPDRKTVFHARLYLMQGCMTRRHKAQTEKKETLSSQSKLQLSYRQV